MASMTMMTMTMTMIGDGDADFALVGARDLGKHLIAQLSPKGNTGLRFNGLGSAPWRASGPASPEKDNERALP